MLLPFVLLGVGVTLVGLALAMDYRGVVQRIVDTFLNPAHADPVLLRTFKRLGFEHPGLDFFRSIPLLRWFLRIWGGFVSVIGLCCVAVSVVHVVPT
ncbi:hypothetical protein HHX38_04490 [Streptomyces sp. PKU-MA01144]|uniref:hypothetical protein n=1 Tax=Streptomyces TaxID=1883 RepID=UPI001479B3A7|nr:MULTISPECIES: hypothetical protein [Streptomyces]MCY0981458.1 hypothetical protein [Streptomyces tirandamycinicus]NNJ03396.1 hypothetical protein [Streptomyces sp. PKU-MA01144]